MSIENIITLASVVGAALFFLAGWLSRALKAGTAAADAEVASLEMSSLRGENARLQDRLKAAQREAQAATAAAAKPVAGDDAKLRAELDEALKQQQALKQGLSQAKREYQQLEQELEKQRTVVTKPEPAPKKTVMMGSGVRSGEEEKLRKQLQEATKARQALEAELKRAKDAATKAAAQKPVPSAKTVETPRADLDALKQQVADLERESDRLRKDAAEAEKLRSKQRHLLVQSRMLEMKADEAERHAKENAALRAQLDDFDRLQRELELFKEKAKSAEAALFAAGVEMDQEQTRVTPMSAVSASSAPSGKTREMQAEEAMAALLAQGSRVVVLSDEQGLQLAGAGETEHQESLAVFAAAISQLGELSREMFPMERAEALLLRDTNGVTVASTVFADAGQPLILSRLGRDLERSGKDVTTCISTLSRVFG